MWIILKFDDGVYEDGALDAFVCGFHSAWLGKEKAEQVLADLNARYDRYARIWKEEWMPWWAEKMRYPTLVTDQAMRAFHVEWWQEHCPEFVDVAPDAYRMVEVIPSDDPNCQGTKAGELFGKEK